MKSRTMMILLVCSLMVAGYFAGYFLSVRTGYARRGNSDYIDGSLKIPYYSPSDAGIVRVLFFPAHFLDAGLLRPNRWDR